MRKMAAGVTVLASGVLVALAAVVFGLTRFGWTPTIAGVCLLVLFLAFSGSEARSFGRSVGYAAVCGFLLAVAAIYPLYAFVPGLASSPEDALGPKPWLPAIWLGGTLAILALDRMRANARPVVLSMQGAPAPVAFEAPPRSLSEPATPLTVAAVSSNPAPAPTPVPVRPPAAVPATPAVPSPKPGAAKPVPRGTPATIYLNLVGSGIACLRAVKAEHLGHDFYRITETIPAGEQWEFQTGQIVRCKKRTLSSGKAMVAVEEAPRAS